MINKINIGTLTAIGIVAKDENNNILGYKVILSNSLEEHNERKQTWLGQLSAKYSKPVDLIKCDNIGHDALTMSANIEHNWQQLLDA